MANSSSYFIHNDDLFRATVVLLTAMTYSVGSSSSTNDSEEIQMIEDRKNDYLTINNHLSMYARDEILIKKSNVVKLARIYNVSYEHMVFRLKMLGLE